VNKAEYYPPAQRPEWATTTWFARISEAQLGVGLTKQTAPVKHTTGRCNETNEAIPWFGQWPLKTLGRETHNMPGSSCNCWALTCQTPIWETDGRTDAGNRIWCIL